ncbi:hypothetical protein [Marinobacter sp. ANT_B65]|uniref:hypothetical protein n=1 Tax=Marinobacter sp. ANT_B65 TaxID=2039467 RepID=UPI000BBEC81C|nr:hypothetical protein [Marinobacter sp. ANT_B65]PCM43749.1 hypothetical protein CPA50_15445 [Marinobacter sp. ANT_B65]
MKEKIVRYTKEELKKLKGKTDHSRVQNTTDEEIEEQVKNDPDSYIPTEEELEKFEKVNKDGSHE